MDEIQCPLVIGNGDVLHPSLKKSQDSPHSVLKAAGQAMGVTHRWSICVEHGRPGFHFQHCVHSPERHQAWSRVPITPAPRRQI